MKEYPIKKGKHALAVGKLEKYNGFDLLIKSWVNIKSDLIIIGQGSQLKSLKRLIERLKLQKKIFIRNSFIKNEILVECLKAKVLIVSSRNDTDENSELVALSLQTPVLGTDTRVMKKILPQELLAKKSNQKSLQKLLETYIDKIDLINQDAIFEFIEEEFSVRKNDSQIMDIYNYQFNN